MARTAPTGRLSGSSLRSFLPAALPMHPEQMIHHLPDGASTVGLRAPAVGQRMERNRRALPLPAQRPDAGPGWRREGTKHSSFYRLQGNSHNIATILPSKKY